MIVFKDLISGDELFSEGHKPKLVDDVIYEVDSEFQFVSNGVDDRLIGANPSGEGDDDEVCETKERVIGLVHGSRLVPCPSFKEHYKSHLKSYLKAIKTHLQEKNPARVEIFENGIKTYMRDVFKNIDDYEFYMGETCNSQGMVVLMNFRSDGMTPYFVFFKDGLVEEKY
ncbi:unnamed protein product [Schistosoma turkestanicum]|nr:unnamed protein product [Schistosoma turkestanicum]